MTKIILLATVAYAGLAGAPSDLPPPGGPRPLEPGAPRLAPLREVPPPEGSAGAAAPAEQMGWERAPAPSELGFSSRPRSSFPS
ncbi:MAG: hypothetical protein AAFZ18_13565 [Myxococcota bacterium]